MITTIIVKLDLGNGVEVSAPLDVSTMSDAERIAFLRFNTSGDLTSLTDEDRDLLSKRKLYVRGEGIEAGFFCRWDWHPVVV